MIVHLTKGLRPEISRASRIIAGARILSTGQNKVRNSWKKFFEHAISIIRSQHGLEIPHASDSVVDVIVVDRH